jgi:hypothetical protein
MRARVPALRVAAQIAVAGSLLLAAAACAGTSGTSSPAGTPARPRAHSASASDSGPGGTGAALRPGAGNAASCGGGAVTNVSTAEGLRAALAQAQPGAEIMLAPGVYLGDFTATASGTRAAPITLCGARNAVLKGTSITHGYTFHLDKASWWRVEGFSVEGGQKGVVTDGATHDLIYGLFVHGTGDEAIHLRSFSSYNVVSQDVVRDTGLDTQFFGEGIYVGSAHKNWCKYTGCHPDASNYNVLMNNNIADTTAENIDIKEGTTGGTIAGNTFNGTGMVASAATAWVNVKGNDWKILDNTGAQSIDDGFQVHSVYPGWGIGNIFRENKAAVPGAGYVIYVQSHHLQTVVACNNAVAGARAQISNVPCQNS